MVTATFYYCEEMRNRMKMELPKAQKVKKGVMFGDIVVLHSKEFEWMFYCNRLNVLLHAHALVKQQRYSLRMTDWGWHQKFTDLGTLHCHQKSHVFDRKEVKSEHWRLQCLNNTLDDMLWRILTAACKLFYICYKCARIFQYVEFKKFFDSSPIFPSKPFIRSKRSNLK